MCIPYLLCMHLTHTYHIKLFWPGVSIGVAPVPWLPSYLPLLPEGIKCKVGSSIPQFLLASCGTKTEPLHCPLKKRKAVLGQLNGLSSPVSCVLTMVNDNGASDRMNRIGNHVIHPYIYSIVCVAFFSCFMSFGLKH